MLEVQQKTNHDGQILIEERMVSLRAVVGYLDILGPVLEPGFVILEIILTVV
jgi:hypothetical protein